MDPVLLQTIVGAVEHLGSDLKDVLGQVLIRKVWSEAFQTKKNTADSADSTSIFLTLELKQQKKKSPARKSDTTNSQQQKQQQQTAGSALASGATTMAAAADGQKRRKKTTKQKEKDRKRLLDFIEKKKKDKGPEHSGLPLTLIGDNKEGARNHEPTKLPRAAKLSETLQSGSSWEKEELPPLLEKSPSPSPIKTRSQRRENQQEELREDNVRPFSSRTQGRGGSGGGYGGSYGGGYGGGARYSGCPSPQGWGAYGGGGTPGGANNPSWGSRSSTNVQRGCEGGSRAYGGNTYGGGSHSAAAVPEVAAAKEEDFDSDDSHFLTSDEE
jgi:hypothetical protein